MKFSSGFAPDIRNIAWTRPRIAPMTKADEADGIHLFPFSLLSISKLPASDFDLHEPSVESEGICQNRKASYKGNV